MKIRTLAVIPARGGSKGILRKNLRVLAGRPLLAHTVEAAVASEGVQRVVVSTDDREIAEVARNCGSEVITRPPEISGDDASSETALIHVLDVLQSEEGYVPDRVVFLQATSPIRRRGDIDGALEVFERESADSLLSVVQTHSFLWRVRSGKPSAVNYDPRSRPRRQDREPEFIENGSIYVLKPWVLREYGNRLGGRIALYVMNPWCGVDIDTREDLDLCEWILSRSDILGDRSGRGEEDDR